MTASLAPLPPPPISAAPEPGVLVACPDARAPAYEAVAGLARAGRLARFVTATYRDGLGPIAAAVADRVPSVRARLGRRSHPEIPADRVEAHPGYDLALAAESRLAGGPRAALARARTRRFDRAVARAVRRHRPAALLAFSDVASEFALPACRDLGLPSILSVVHGDVREEMAVLDREAARAPEFFPIYLGDGPIDRDALRWLHERRLRDAALADRILVPSQHLAAAYERAGTPRDRIAVVPYAADVDRFRPAPNRPHGPGCTFLFAGGITQRKGIKDLLDAWRLVRRPGWRLQLLGALPRDPLPLAPYRDEFEHLGRVGRDEVPARMAAADVFVFPSLFEGSAVVTYEALACGLPCVVTAEAGSVVRDGAEGFVVPACDPEALAAAMERLGADPGLRAAMGRAARARAEQYSWARYHRAVAGVVETVIGR